MSRHESTSIVRHVLGGTFWLFLAQALMVPSGLATVAYLTRALGPGLYGSYAIVITIVMWVEFSIASVLQGATVRFVSHNEDWQPVAVKAMQLNLIAGAFAMVALWAVSDTIAIGLGDHRFVWYLRLAAIDIPVFVLGQAHLWVLSGLGRFRDLAWAFATRWVARLFLIMLLVQVGLSVTGAILGCIGASISELAVCRFFCRPGLAQRSGFPASRLWGYAVPLFLLGMTLRFLDGLDLIVLKLMGGGAEQAGVYAAALCLALLPGMVAAAASPVLLSTLTRLLSAGRETEARHIGQQAIRCLLLMLPLVGLVSGAATEIATLCFGQQFAPAGPLLAVLMLAGYGRLVIATSSTMLTALGKPAWGFLSSGPAIPLGVIGYVLLIPRFGPMGAACVTAAACALAALACTGAACWMWRVVPPADTALRCALTCVLVFVWSSSWESPGFLLLLKLAIIGGLIVPAFLLIRELMAHRKKSATLI